MAAALLALTACWATSTWALLGSAISVYLRQPCIKAIVNTAVAVLLVYTAIELSGLL